MRLTVATIALPGFDFCLCLSSTVSRQGATHIIAFFELARTAAAHKALVGAGINQFALGSFAFNRS